MIYRLAALLSFLWLSSLAQGGSPHSSSSSSTLPRGQLRRRLLPQQERIDAADEAKAALDATTRDLQADCLLESSLYGSFGGSYRSVGFRYQAVFIPGTSQTEITRNILPVLESNLVQGILPAFFDCPTENPTGVVNGISPDDADVLAEDGR
jgi:hypothetical protein